jgi:hypothetical protein
MRPILALTLLLACAACDPADAPAEKLAEQAEKIVEPAPLHAAAVAKGRFAPRDECGELEGAAEFRERLIETVQLRDADALVALAAEDIKLDFGGGAGTAELRSRLYNEPYNLWQELEALLPLGCAANEQGGITIPWIFAQDLGQADPYASMLVLGEDVPVLSAPRASAERIGTISWDLVTLPSLQDGAFQQITLPGDRTGFIASDKLRSVLDYRILASRRNGQWSMTSLIAGD